VPFVTSQKIQVYPPIQYPGGHVGPFCLPEFFEKLQRLIRILPSVLFSNYQKNVF
jgi:hypothetical protein